MPGPSPFADDWRECLIVHYQYTVHQQDIATERTLSEIMRGVGFSDEQLAELKVLATIRAEEMPPDFVPDVELLVAMAQTEPVSPPEHFQIVVPELPEGIEPPEEVVLLDELIQEEAVIEPELLEHDEAEPEPELEPELPQQDGPAQLSMF
ncbi:MAG: hypothetical protein IAE89_05420 [Anaerolineae bacterium]|nr:hypothetical protein [Anaerolineae bacterium]